MRYQRQRVHRDARGSGAAKGQPQFVNHAADKDRIVFADSDPAILAIQ